MEIPLSMQIQRIIRPIQESSNYTGKRQLRSQQILAQLYKNNKRYI